jgi:hypothetical protein
MMRETDRQRERKRGDRESRKEKGDLVRDRDRKRK